MYLSQKKTAPSAPYNINGLVFITEMKSVYCKVLNGSLNKADFYVFISEKTANSTPYNIN
jgi:hypothetical protein